MGVGENLFNNLLVAGILGSLMVIVYCKIRNQSLRDLIQDIRGGLAAPVGVEQYE